MRPLVRSASRSLALLAAVVAPASAGMFDRPAWTQAGTPGSAFGTTAKPAGDVNGDGFDDLLIGAPGEARVHLFLGSAQGLLPTPAWSLDVGVIGDGRDLAAGVGDLDADGFADVAVAGAPPRIFRGSPTGLASVADWTLAGVDPARPFPAGDVDHDGYDDLVVWGAAVTCHHGSATGPSAMPDVTLPGVAEPAPLGDVNGDGFDDLVVRIPRADGATLRAHHGSPAGLQVAPAWSVDETEPSFGRAHFAAGDVDGDGFADLVVGSDEWTHFEPRQGEWRLYEGSASGLAPAAARTIRGRDADSGLGLAVGTVGDVNGDGFGDFIATSRLEFDAPSSWDAQVIAYAGGPFGPSGPSAFWNPGGAPPGPEGMRAGLAGDVNGDGFSDVVVALPGRVEGGVASGRAWVFHGRGFLPFWFAQPTIRGARPRARLGTSVALVGDVNGDGYGDAVVGAPGDQVLRVGEGTASLHLGGASGLAAAASWTARGGQAHARFGEAVASAGDVNGDGYADVAVGAPGHDGAHVDGGRVRLYLGGPAGLAATPAFVADGDALGGRLGTTLSAGDLDGDGRPDLVAGSGRGTRTQVWRSGPDGPISGCADEDIVGDPDCASATATAVGDVDGNGSADVVVAGDCDGGGRVHVQYRSGGILRTVEGLGTSFTVDGSPPVVAPAGDVNGDGLADVLIAQPAALGFTGKAQLHLGTPAGLDPLPAWEAHGVRAGDRFGSAVASAGDMDGDGYGDLVIGAPGHEVLIQDEGSVFGFLGSPTGASRLADWIRSSSGWRSRMGTSVAGQGDVDGDGFSDVLAGGPGAPSPAVNEGAAWLFAGNDGEGRRDRNPRQLRSDGTTPIALGGLVPGGERVRFEMGADSPFGRDEVRLVLQLESATGIPFGGPAERGAWNDTGTPGAAGSHVVLSDSSAPLDPDAYRWRARLEGRFALPWRSPWFSLPGNAVALRDFVVAGDADLDGVPDDADTAPTTRNPGQEDGDGDGIADVLDDCPGVAGTDEDCDGLCADVDPCPGDPLGDGDGDGLCADVDKCAGSANPGQEDADGDGIGDACDSCPASEGADEDGDGRCGALDPCPFDPADDADGDGDCGDVDTCPDVPNASQADADRDGLGDACDACPSDAANDADGDGACADADPCDADPGDDADGDGRCADVDVCPDVADPGQEDGDGDGLGDACDPCLADSTNDPDGDGACDDADPCPLDPLDDADGDGLCAEDDNCASDGNPSQSDRDGDGRGDACDACPDDPRDDIDGDGTCAPGDVCPDVTDPGQEDGDGDGVGNACDDCPGDAGNDSDGDGVCAASDNCPGVRNPGQEDADGDGAGDACSSCDSDGDGVCDDVDTCPGVRDLEQLDADGDGVGDACDPCFGDDAGGDADRDATCDDRDVCPAAWDPSQGDADGDGDGDACDCPALGTPESLRVARGAGTLVLSWTPSSPPWHEVHAGSLDALWMGRAYDHAVASSVNVGTASVPMPASNVYLLVTATCGVVESSYGSDSFGQERPPSWQDADLDGVPDATDACPNVPDAAQEDADGDRVGDACDGCPAVADPRQSDRDADGLGDACDGCPLLSDLGGDFDLDGRGDACDNCRFVGNPSQADTDGDGMGDACRAGTARLVVRAAGVGDVVGSLFDVRYPLSLAITDRDVAGIGPYATATLVSANTTTPGLVAVAAIGPSPFAAPADVIELTFAWEGAPPVLEDFSFEPGSCRHVSETGAELPLTSCQLSSLTILP